VTGHRGLLAETTELIDRAVREALTEYGPEVTGLSNLADGADQIFARAIIDAGGTLEVIIPAKEYRARLPGDARQEYDELIARASAVRELPFTASTAESHMAAGKLMIDSADELFAIWDSQPARGYGGTADVVWYARQRGMPVRVIWPEGARRD